LALLNLRDVRLAFGGLPLLDGVDFRIEPGERVCLLGRNGQGKSTLLKVAAGELPPDSGEIVRQQGLKVALVPQEAPPGLSGSVYDVVAGGSGPVSALLSEHHRISHALAAGTGEGAQRLLGELSRVQDEIRACDGWTLQQEAEKAISRLSLDPEGDFATLSGGVRRRTLIARALCHGSDLLLLDEPTNHLDIDAIAGLEEFLVRGGLSLLFVTHDRAFLRKVATRIVELDRGRLFDWECGYDTFLARREAALEAEATQRDKFDKRLAEEEAWIRRGVKARTTRNEGRVRALMRMREERKSRRERTGSVRMEVTEAVPSGRLVAEATELVAGYGGAPVLRGVTTTILRGDRVGILGPNGAGKTTLLKTLLGELPPLSGTVRLGTRLEVAYSDQLREELDEGKTVAEVVGDGNDTVTVNGRRRHIVGYLQEFLFPPDRARSPVSMLSGGERNRLQLAKLFTKPFNLLVLDEPTNDLDLETLDLLEELLMEYDGTLLLVSHDRAFLENVVTSTLVLPGDGSVIESAGGYEEWLARRASLLPSAPEAPEGAEGAEKGRQKREAPRKLSYREQRELAELPGRIAAAEGEIAALEEEKEAVQRILSDPAFYREEAARVAEVRGRLAALEGEIEAAYARWEALESARAELSAVGEKG
jgi:ATP-binding cassette subfamily F protein uup